ncbi:hypothetical protein B296_00003169 [Ensete ventricosum]|uniref:Uncharacterized protein n=1 Tax=Ensete ventricosum TaxID=4639 RepID=A0A427ANB9_ENSVE|nr:hypothetical protein B296_00003169 [Ensete ventricosum]
MSQECPSDNSNAEHRTEPNYPPQAEEVTTSGPTPNRFWRMMTDPGFSLPVSNPAPFVITAEAFLDLTNQVQALAGMVQTIVPYLPQLIQSVTIQSALLATPPQMESHVAPNREVQPEAEVPQRRTTKVHAASPDLDTLLSDSADSLREQVHQVHQQLDEVQKEVLKSKGEFGESSKGGSIQTTKEEGRQARHVAIQTSSNTPQLNLNGDLPPDLGERASEDPQSDEDTL